MPSKICKRCKEYHEQEINSSLGAGFLLAVILATIAHYYGFWHFA
ncbi:hypothetical protein [Pseudomonas fulva]|nr:hypothetical protein [Pseudomonas fulva]